MNNIDEIIEIIENLGGSASLLSICDEYQKKHGVVLSSNHRVTIARTLNENIDKVYLDKDNYVWKLGTDTNNILQIKHKENNELNELLLRSNGSLKLSEVFDSKGIAWELRKANNCANLFVNTNKYKAMVFENRINKIRVNMRTYNPLAKEYKRIGGYLEGEKNKKTVDGNQIEVFFDEDKFNDLANYIKNKCL